MDIEAHLELTLTWILVNMCLHSHREAIVMLQVPGCQHPLKLYNKRPQNAWGLPSVQLPKESSMGLPWQGLRSCHTHPGDVAGSCSWGHSLFFSQCILGLKPASGPEATLYWGSCSQPSDYSVLLFVHRLIDALVGYPAFLPWSTGFS